MKRLSVAYLVPSLNYGGSETLLLSFLKFLDRNRFEPEVHCFYEAGKLAPEFRAAGIPLHDWRSPRRDPVTFVRLIRHLRQRGFHIVHTHLFDRQGRVAAFLAGRTAPRGKVMGHAGAIIMGERGTAESKIRAFQEAGIPVASTLQEVPELARKLLIS